MQVQRWRNHLLLLRNALAPSPQIAQFHSTPISQAKWKSKWKKDAGREPSPSSSKNYIRYVTRQKRADAKKALKDLLFNTSCRVSFQDEDGGWSESDDENVKRVAEDVWPKTKKSSKKAKPYQTKSKRRRKKRSYSSDHDEYSETIFHATFGHRCFTWSSRSWEDVFNFGNPSFGFEWRDDSDDSARRWSRRWKPSESDLDEDDDASVGLDSHRVTLGLPPKGPLKIEDVKSAFRASALKWHPDKHQGPSKDKAEEKFKLCVDAYKSLCNALSA